MGTTEDLAKLAQRFDADRRHLKSVAFQLLGSLPDAEDAVQSAWLKASRSDFAAVDNLTGWLTTITAHEAVDQLRARQRRFERPLIDAADLDRMVAAPADEDTLLADSVSRALLVVLDQLSPAQRVAFVLHDVFAIPFETIAALLDRSPTAAKKLASRARVRLHPDPDGQAPRAAEHVQLVKAFLTAARGGDIGALAELLAPDVVRRVDRALVADDVPTELRGAREVAEETRRFAGRARAGVVVLIDGAPGIAIAPTGHAQTLLRLGFDAADRIRTIDISADAHRAVLALPSWPPERARSGSSTKDMRRRQ
ncbi:RNA polymerase sigma factor SigJ [Mycobacterium basiliense]|uniref:RNA polymerase sigma factor SigJ n=1 Tax=Mycobacterium basiliense TaxID=2094119 RepID=A0A447GFD7_9MYCO|nr:sigma-70 family RNA polymerase sigma factor [Mycobacterium basiliense]VDM89227.1 RNA polymerase sigma factor SigJ [Mycobacterium basiliense]